MMNLCSDTRVLRGPDADLVVTAVLSSDLRSGSPLMAGTTMLDPRSVDPRLQQAFVAAVEDVRSRAKVDGFDEGYRAGMQQAAAEMAAAEERQTAAIEKARQLVAAESSAALRAMWDAVQESNQRDAVAIEAMEDAAIAVAIRLTELLLAGEIGRGAEASAHILRRALRELPAEGEITIRVAPQHAAQVGLLMAGDSRRTTVIPDPAISGYGGRLECGATRLDARLDAAFARIAEALQS